MWLTMCVWRKREALPSAHINHYVFNSKQGNKHLDSTLI